MSTLPTYLKSLDILELKFALEFLILTGIWLHIFLSPSFYAWRKPPRDILTLTETESRLSLGMTSNKTYHFQTTANHHRFIKVWTSIADLPTSIFFVQTFFLEKVRLKNTLPTYDLDIVSRIPKTDSNNNSYNYKNLKIMVVWTHTN